MWKKFNGKSVKYCESYIDRMTGKRKEVSVTYSKDTKKNEKEASRLLQEKISAKQEPSYESLTLGELSDLYIENISQTCKPSSLVTYKSSQKNMLKAIGRDVLVDSLTVHYISKKLSCKQSATTRNSYRSALKSVLKFGYQEDYTDTLRLFNKIVSEKVSTKKKKKYLELWEYKAVVELLPERYKMLSEFLVLTGMRVGEAIALTRSDIDLTANVIHVTKTFCRSLKRTQTPKTASSDSDVYIQPQLKACIVKAFAYFNRLKLSCGAKTDLVFTSTLGDHINYNNYSTAFARASEKALGIRMTPHSLRHTHASLLFEQGFELEEVQRRLRHADSRITKDVYIHVTQSLAEKDTEHLKDVAIL